MAITTEAYTSQPQGLIPCMQILAVTGHDSAEHTRAPTTHARTPVRHSCGRAEEPGARSNRGAGVEMAAATPPLATQPTDPAAIPSTMAAKTASPIMRWQAPAPTFVFRIVGRL